MLAAAQTWSRRRPGCSSESIGPQRSIPSLASGAHEAGGYAPAGGTAACSSQSTDYTLPDAPTVLLTRYLGALEPGQVDT